MALIHHWKFSNNTQDAIGSGHFVDLLNTPTYTENKDGVENWALDNTSGNYIARTDIDINDYDYEYITYSFWLQKKIEAVSTIKYKTIFSDYRSIVMWRNYSTENYNSIYIRGNNKGSISGSSWSVPNALEYVNEDEWCHIVIKINYTNTLKSKLFVNGVLKSIVDFSSSLYYGGQGFMINGNIKTDGSYSTSGDYLGNTRNIDEIKYYNNYITDGEVTVVGQVASLDSEVWQLYLAGVNNIPAYTMNPVTDITGTTGRLSWTGS